MSDSEIDSDAVEVTSDDEEDHDSGNAASDSDSDEPIGIDHLNDGPSCASAKDGSSRMEIEEEYKFQVLTTEQILQHMVDTIKEVNTIVLLPPTVTRILLNHFKWDKEKLYERFVSRSWCQREAKNSWPSFYKQILWRGSGWSFSRGSNRGSKPHDIESKSQGTKIRTHVLFCSLTFVIDQKHLHQRGIENCIICCRDLPSPMMTSLDCGHRFCKECWASYLTTKIIGKNVLL